MNALMAIVSDKISSLLSGKNQNGVSTEVAVLAELSRNATEPFSSPDAFGRFAGLVNQVIRYDRIVVTVVDLDRETFRLAHVLGTEVPDFEQGDVISLRRSFVNDVVTLGKPIPFKPSRQSTQKVGFLLAGLPSRIGTPLNSNGQVIGTLHLASKQANAYGEHELGLLEQIGHRISGVVASAFLLESEKTRTAQLNALYEVAAILARPQSFEEKAHEIVDTLVRITEADQAVLRRAIPGTDDLVLISAVGTFPIENRPVLSARDEGSLSSQAYLEGVDVVINDYQSYPDAQADRLALGFRSACSLPIRSGDRTLGLLSLGSTAIGHFNRERFSLAKAFADEIVPLFESADLSESLQASKEEMALVDEVSKLVTSTLKIQDVYETFAKEVRKLVDFDRMTISVIDDVTQTIMVKYAFGDTVTNRGTGDAVPIDQSTAYAMISSGIPVFLSEEQAETAQDRSVEQRYLALGLRSRAVVPLKSSGRIIGSMILRSRRSEAFGAREQAMILRLADQIAPAIQNAILFERSVASQKIQTHLADENEMLAKIGRIVGSPISNEYVYRQLTDAVRGLIPFDRITITVLDAVGEYTSSEYIRGMPVSGWEQGAVKRMDGKCVPFISAIMARESPVTLNVNKIEDLQDSYPTLAEFYEAGLRSFLGCRLMTNDRVIGTLQLASVNQGHYGLVESRLVERIANQVAGSIANATLLNAERERSSQMEALYGVAAILVKPQSFETKAQAIIDILFQVFEADLVTLRRGNEKSPELKLLAAATAAGVTAAETLEMGNQDSSSTKAFRESRTIVIDEYEQHTDAQPDPLNQGIRSAITLPIILDGRTLGLLSLGSKSPNHFNRGRVDLVSVFAAEIGSLFEAAELTGVIEASQGELALADEIARIITTTIEVEDVYKKFAIEVKKLVDYDLAGVVHINEDLGEFTIHYLSGDFGEKFCVGKSFPIEGTVTSEVIRTRDTVNVGNMESRRDLWPTTQYIKQGIYSVIAAPLMSGDLVHGAFFLASRRLNAFGIREQVIVQRLANQIAPAIKNSELNQETRQLAGENASMAKIGRIVSSQFSSEGVYENFADAVQDLIPFDRITITSCGTEDESNVNLYVRGTTVADWEQGIALPMDSSGFALEIIGARRAIAFNPASLDELERRYPKMGTFHKMGLRSFVGSPLVTNDQVIGAIFLSSATVGAYTDHEADLLQRISNQAAGSIHNVTLMQTERERVKQLEALFAVAAIKAKPISFESKCESIVETLLTISDVEGVILRRANDASGDLELVAEVNSYSLISDPVINLIERSHAWGKAIREGMPVVINDYQNHPNALPDQLARGISSAFLLPVMSAGLTLGLLSLSSRAINHFNKDRVALLTAFADEVGGLFESAGLSQTLQASREEMELIDRIAEIITSSEHIDDAYPKFYAQLAKLIKFDRIVINIVDEQQENFSARFVNGVSVDGTDQGAMRGIEGTRVERLVNLGERFIQEEYRKINSIDRFTAETNKLIDSGMEVGIGVSLQGTSRVVGTLHLHSKNVQAFGTREKAIIMRLANQIAPAVENALLLEQTEEAEQTQRRLADELTARNNEIALVDRISAIITSSKNMDDTYLRFSEELRKVIDFDRIAVNVIDHKERTFIARFVAGSPVEGREQGTLHKIKGTIIERLIRYGGLVVREDFRNEELAVSDQRFIKAGLAASLSIPLISSLGIIATLHIHSQKTGVFGKREQDLLERVAATITPSIENALLNDALVQGEAQRRALLETTSDAIITIDEHGLVQSFNPSAEELFGYSAAEIMGRNISILLPESEMGEHDDRIARYLTTGEGRTVGESGRVLEARNKSGAIFPAELWIGVIENDRDRGFIGIIRRLDERTAINDAGPHKDGVEKISDEMRPRLTNREVEVLHLLADGGRNKDVAEHMTVSLHTVKFHIENLYIKLGVRTRGELIRVASRLGLLTE